MLLPAEVLLARGVSDSPHNTHTRGRPEAMREYVWQRGIELDDHWKRDAAREGRSDQIFDPAEALQALPQCIQTCLARGPPGDCSMTDYACLCGNDQYLGSVMNCWTINCNSTELQVGVMSATALCNRSLDPDAPWPAESNVIGQPVIYSKAAWNIQAVMSSVCSLILVVAIALGVMSCRAQARKDAQQQRSITAVTKSRPTLFSGQGSGSSGRDQVTTFDFGDESVITSLPRPFMAGSRKVPRFTDVDESPEEKECWEMTESPQRSPTEPKTAEEILKDQSISSASAASGSEDKGKRPASQHSSSSGESADQKETVIVIGPNTGVIPTSQSLASVHSPASRTEFSDTEPFAARGA